MATDRINVVFQGPNTADGVSLRDLNVTFTCLQDAVRRMASHLAGVGNRGRGPGPKWLREQVSLRLVSTFSGSFVATLALPPGRAGSDGKDFGADALQAILAWSGEDDGSLPPEVFDSLHSIATSLSPDVDQVHLAGELDGGRHVTIQRATRERIPAANPVPSDSPAEISMHGRLLEVDWKNGTAQLHNYGERPVDLRFAASLNEAMRQLATRYVKVRGAGSFNYQDEWETVAVHEIVAEWSVVDDFYAREPKVFDPEKASSYYQDDDDDPIDIEEFIRVIREARDT